VPSSARRGGKGRGLRIGLAVAVMAAALTGGAVWLGGKHIRPAAAPGAPTYGSQTGSGSTAPSTTAATHSALQQMPTPTPSAAPTPEAAALAPAVGVTGATLPRMEDFTTPGGETVVPRAAVAEIQRLLARLDFDPGPATGEMGQKTIEAIASYQAMAGMPADGKPSVALLEELREVAETAQR
jgi:peptidoglycan hydrolase-like protein with peptidoglycan-binding domain